MTELIKYPKPILKWVGGKTQIINEIMKNVPKKIENYHEIFLGGGSVLFAMLYLVKNNKINIRGTVYAYDLNSQLINVYRHIQNNKEELFALIQNYRAEYDGCPSIEKKKGVEKKRKKIQVATTIEEAKICKESYYYWLREKFKKTDNNSVENSALFIVINKLCFRGVYREGPNGFNVPYGNYKKTPVILTREEIDNIHLLIKDVVFICADFTESMANIAEGDYVYLDPPYAPENETSFVGYTAKGFKKITHEKLFELTKGLTKKGAKFTMSNANVDLVKNSFKKYKKRYIDARRSCNSKNPAAKTVELLIRN